ncbi:MAG: SDR family NAD(P)-dependent oxidoreductase, partial [Ferruginibacter sp.]
GPEIYYLADFIKRNYKVDVVAFENDLTIEEDCIQVYNKVIELGLEVNILINNAGLGGTMLFSEGPISFYKKQIKLNILATTLLTHLFLDSLNANGPSYILNVGSLSSYFFLPKKQVYGATKSFIYCFSKSLNRELKKSKISVSVICPGNMNTNISVTQLIKTSNWFSRHSVMNPEDVAPVAINGLLNKKEVIIPGRLNKIFLLMNKLLPSFIKNTLIGRQMKTLKSVTATELKEKTMIFIEPQNSLIA